RSDRFGDRSALSLERGQEEPERLDRLVGECADIASGSLDVLPVGLGCPRMQVDSRPHHDAQQSAERSRQNVESQAEALAGRHQELVNELIQAGELRELA